MQRDVRNVTRHDLLHISGIQFYALRYCDDIGFLLLLKQTFRVTGMPIGAERAVVGKVVSGASSVADQKHLVHAYNIDLEVELDPFSQINL
jgi:hypothetical protein